MTLRIVQRSDMCSQPPVYEDHTSACESPRGDLALCNWTIPNEGGSSTTYVDYWALVCQSCGAHLPLPPPRDPAACVQSVKDLALGLTGDRETAELVGEAMQPWVEGLAEVRKP